MSIQSCPNLETKSIRLRPLEQSDARELHALWSDPLVKQMSGIDGDQSLASIEGGLNYFIGLNQAGFYNKWILEEKDTHQMVGECEFYPVRPQIRPWLEWNIGFSSKPEFWGKGYMSEVLSEVIDFGFTKTSAIRINADVLHDNERSKNFLLKNGFVPESQQHQKFLIEGQFRNSVQFVYLKQFPTECKNNH